MKTSLLARVVLAASLVGAATAASAAPKFNQYSAIVREQPTRHDAPAVAQEMQVPYHPGLAQPGEPIQVRRTETLTNY